MQLYTNGMNFLQTSYRFVPRRFLISTALVLIVAAGVATIALAHGNGPHQAVEVASTPTPSPLPSLRGPQAPDVTARPLPRPSQATGRIAGQRLYPSEQLPSDFTTCAINLASGQATCLGGNQQTYELSLPSGQYQVYAVVPSLNPTYKAYYSRFIACGLRVDCTDHTPIVVTVPAGGTVGGIDVGDFYL